MQPTLVPAQWTGDIHGPPEPWCPSETCPRYTPLVLPLWGSVDGIWRSWPGCLIPAPVNPSDATLLPPVSPPGCPTFAQWLLTASASSSLPFGCKWSILI